MVILRGYSLKKHNVKRNLGSPVKSCSRVSLICLSESVRRGPVLIGCDIYWGLILDAHDCKYADTDKDKLKRLGRIEENKSEDNL